MGTEFNALDDGQHPLTVAFAHIIGDPISKGLPGLALFFLYLSFPILRVLPTKKARLFKEAFDTMTTETEKFVCLVKSFLSRIHRSLDQDYARRQSGCTRRREVTC